MLIGETPILIPLEYHEIRIIDFLLEKALLRNPNELKFLRELDYQRYEYMWDESLTDERMVKTSIWTPGIFHLQSNPQTSRLSDAEHFLKLIPQIITTMHNTWTHKKEPFKSLLNKLVYFHPKYPFIGSDNLIKYFELLTYGYRAMPSYWSTQFSHRTRVFEDYTSEIGVCFADAIDYYKLNNPGVQNV